MRRGGQRPNTSVEYTLTWESLGLAQGLRRRLGMRVSCIWTAAPEVETILFSEPPDLPLGHKWVFALADAGVLIDLHKSPTFLMLPGRDVLHGTLYTGKGTGEDHIEHSSGGSALMNKLRMTGASSKAYERLHLAKENRTCSHEPSDVRGKPTDSGRDVD